MANVKKEEVEISKEDQQNINNFSKLNLKFHEKLSEMKQKQELHEAIDDVNTEMDLLDDDTDIRLKFGDCFVRVEKEFCSEYLEKTQKNTKEEIDDLKFMVEDTQKRMNKLKSVLYGKFGNSIQLEE